MNIRRTIHAAVAVALAAGGLAGAPVAPPATPAAAESSTVASADVPRPAGYELAWTDEFDGTEPGGTGLDTHAWYYREGEKAICSNSPDNVSVAGGKLRIALKRQDRNGKQYTCGGVISKQWFGYGYYETRAELWGDRGFHSAFWTTGLSDSMPDTPGYKGPNNRVNEIDGFEIDSHAPTRIAHHSHWFVPRHIGNQGGLYVGPDSSDGYHTYGFEWLPTEIRYYVDGMLARVQPYAGPHGLQSIWLTTLGYTAPVDEGNLPGETTWDYFRYYAPTDGGNDAAPGSAVVDNGDAGYAESGEWKDAVTDSHEEAFGFQDRQTRRSDSPDAAATWTPELEDAGEYEVLAWNPSFLATGHTAARYTVAHAGGSSDVVVNQSTAGQQWVSLGSYRMKPGAGHGLRLTGDTSGKGTLRADSAMFTPAIVVDNGGALDAIGVTGSGYSETGTWSTSSAVAGWRDTDTRYASSSTSAARWTPELPESGTYAVYAWTPVHESNTNIARYKVVHNGGPAVVEVDHVDRWTKLGTFAFEAGAGGYVELGKDTGVTGNLRADAVKFVPVPAADDDAPAVPSDVRGDVYTVPDTGDAVLTWHWRTVHEPDLVGYHVYLDGQRVSWKPVQRPSFRMRQMLAGQTYKISVTSVDSSGNESAPSRRVPIRIPADTRPPAAPDTLIGEAANGMAILYWEQNSEVDLLGYRIYADGELVTTGDPVGHPADPDFTRLGFPVHGLANNVEHSLEVRAVDLSGNESRPAAVAVTPLPMNIVGIGDEGYTEQGAWTPSSVRGWLSSPTRTTNVTSATAQWHPELAVAGTYDVYAWVPNHANSTTAARYTVTHAGGTGITDIDQTTGGNQWILLGRHEFDVGTAGHVTVSNAAGRGYLRTSAVKFIPVS
ncbi:family 16 glycosylhydrolase [Kribbella sp. NBC_01245]|uniref:golvesin C-terminal-like domain-containing protein n=1 Tax=Kribbella sp. NBC_01245 TaxID=2903578 RepID=UPI002E2CE712|nr:family 16 glycosylhydrolase [Kribbella sp. NBC_01245]